MHYGVNLQANLLCNLKVQPTSTRRNNKFNFVGDRWMQGNCMGNNRTTGIQITSELCTTFSFFTIVLDGGRLRKFALLIWLKGAT